jgi:predicted RNase H-like HicB family nuclease
MTDLLQAAEKVASAAQESQSTRTHTAIYQRDPSSRDYWLVELAEEPRVHSFGRSLAEAERRIADATRLWFDIPEDGDLRLDARFNDAEVDAHLQEAEALRLLYEAITRELRNAMRASTELLRYRLNLSMRDAGAVLGVSHQRVHQLLEEHSNEIVSEEHTNETVSAV